MWICVYFAHQNLGGVCWASHASLVYITTSWAVAPCLVRTCSTCLVVSSSGGAVTTLQACTSHHVTGWAVLKPHAWLMMLLLNWGVTPVYYVYSIKSLYVWQPEHSRAPADTIYMYGTLSIQELLANILAPTWCAYCLPHVSLWLSWRFCLCVWSGYTTSYTAV